MVNDIAIWGTGRLGNVAYSYYKEICNIVCYVDNDERKWGKTLNGINICSPDILKSRDIKIVLAMKRGIDDVRRQLAVEYGIQSVEVFQIKQEICSETENFDEIQEDTCIVSFAGGLGNQMFQYAFLRNLQNRGNRVMADLSADIGTTGFHLLDVFKKINIKECTKQQKKDLVEKNMEVGNRKQKFYLYTEESKNDVKEKEGDLSILDATGGIFYGFFQTYKYAEQIRDLLIEDFQFEEHCEEKLKAIRDIIVNENAVSIHIRRGDYLFGNNNWVYGNICTSEYYRNAMLYIKNKIGNCKFICFSNDIEWAKNNCNDIGKILYIEDSLFDNYQDWYDMYLMSICKHNIIANSTFSWWGAWLNQNREKIVIAPKKWVNVCDYKDIWPEKWVQI